MTSKIFTDRYHHYATVMNSQQPVTIIAMPKSKT